MKTKIIPTFSIDTTKKYEERLLFYRELGIETIRLNLTRYSISEYKLEIEKINNVQNDLWGEKLINIMLDVPFPGTKSRVKFDGDSRDAFINKGDILTITNCENKMNIKKNIFYVENIDDLHHANIGETIEIDDGRLNLEVSSKEKNDLKLIALNDANFHYMKAINRKGTIFFKEERDQYLNKLISLIKETDTKTVCFSFVESEEQMKNINNIFANNNIDCIPKIETLEGIVNLEKILKNCNTAMLGRGDMALTSGIHSVGLAQEHFINECKKNNNEIIIATDIMNSAVEFSLSVPLRSDLVDLDLILSQSVDYVVASGPLSNSYYLKDFDMLIDNISKFRNEGIKI